MQILEEVKHGTAVATAAAAAAAIWSIPGHTWLLCFLISITSSRQQNQSNKVSSSLLHCSSSTALNGIVSDAYLSVRSTRKKARLASMWKRSPHGAKRLSPVFLRIECRAGSACFPQGRIISRPARIQRGTWSVGYRKTVAVVRRSHRQIEDRMNNSRRRWIFMNPRRLNSANTSLRFVCECDRRVRDVGRSVGPGWESENSPLHAVPSANRTARPR